MRKMSMLGPDDFDLTRKERAKKLAKDLSPAVQKEIDQWIDKLDEQEALKRISDLVGLEEARLLIAHLKHKRIDQDKEDRL